MQLVDYHTKAIVATFNGSNSRNIQVMAWIQENNYLVHRQYGNKLIVISK